MMKIGSFDETTTNELQIVNFLETLKLKNELSEGKQYFVQMTKLRQTNCKLWSKALRNTEI